MNNSKKTIKAYTDYPFIELGDITETALTPIREVEVIGYDGDKYCDIIVEGIKANIKAGYLYSIPARYNEYKGNPLKLGDLK